MAVRPILEIPHPMLRRKAKRVRSVDSSVLRLAHDMVDTMREASGVGLAANQVGELQRVIVIQLSEEDDARIYINPEIVLREGEREVEEGCLSIPGYRGFITRSVSVKFRALDHTSKVVKLKADDVLAQALEHEVDHLNGILFTDHLESHEKLFKVAVAAKQEEQQGDSPSGSAEMASPSNGRAEGAGDLWVPGDESRDFPASLKVR